jgi:hypothetical protein
VSGADERRIEELRAELERRELALSRYRQRVYTGRRDLDHVRLAELERLVEHARRRLREASG